MEEFKFIDGDNVDDFVYRVMRHIFTNKAAVGISLLGWGGRHSFRDTLSHKALIGEFSHFLGRFFF